MDNNEIDKLGLGSHFEELKRNPAYIYVKQWFDEESLRSRQGDLQLMAEKFIAESAIKSVFRAIDGYASGSGIMVGDTPEKEALLEPEFEDTNETSEEEDIFA